MDLKAAGNALYCLGVTRDELGGSHAAMVLGQSGGIVPKVDAAMAMRVFSALHHAIQKGWIRACHDLSEGGLAVTLAEMSFAGGLGIDVDIQALTRLMFLDPQVVLFAESNSRFVCEVPLKHVSYFEDAMRELPCVKIGTVNHATQVKIKNGGLTLIDMPWQTLKSAWLAPLDWE
jgi:phosphoribosylformylglycinamidine synthase